MQVVSALFGAGMGLLRLNLGVVSNFDELLQNFHQGPAQWWHACISEKGTRNIPGCDQPAQMYIADNLKDVKFAPVSLEMFILSWKKVEVELHVRF